MAAHAEFDKLWKNKHMSRKNAYKWLRRQLDLASEDCHIKEFDAETCNRVVTLVHRKFEELLTAV